jgi:hypothetical protein
MESSFLVLPGDDARAEADLFADVSQAGDISHHRYAHRFSVASVASVASVQSRYGCDRAKVRWAKALWWATQEARRRKAQHMVDQKLARSKSRPGGLRQWIMKSNSSTVAPLTSSNLVQSTSDSMSSRNHLKARSSILLSSTPSTGKGTLEKLVRSSPKRDLKQQQNSEDPADIATESHTPLQRWIARWRPGGFSTFSRSSALTANVQRVLQSPAYVYLTVICTFWVLGGDDLYLLQDPPVSLDRAVYSLYLVCAAQFLLDLLLRAFWESAYAFGFYFWLDLIALISLAPEVVFVIADYDLFDLGVASLARSGRAASAGARIVRILRIVKLLKQIYVLKTKRNHEADNELGDTSSSELARMLNDYVTIHVIVAVGAMLALSMALTLAYSCTQETILDLAVRAYLRPLERCLATHTHAERRKKPSPATLACVQAWQNTTLADMRLHFSQEPYNQPLVYLSVDNITLYGAPHDYAAYFRKKPKSYLIRRFDDLEVGSGIGVVHVGNKAAVLEESRANLFTVASVLAVLWMLSLTLTSSMRREILGPMQVRSGVKLSMKKTRKWLLTFTQLLCSALSP